MTEKDKEFIELMLKKSKEKPVEVKDPFHNLKQDEI